MLLGGIPFRPHGNAATEPLFAKIRTIILFSPIFHHYSGAIQKNRPLDVSEKGQDTAMGAPAKLLYRIFVDEVIQRCYLTTTLATMLLTLTR